MAGFALADGHQVLDQQNEPGYGDEAEQQPPVHGLLEPGMVLGTEVSTPSLAFQGAFHEGLLVAFLGGTGL